MNQPAQKGVVLITGCSSGIGRATALRLADDGYEVYATCRSLATPNDLQATLHEFRNAHLLELDVTREASVAAAVREVVDASGTIDAVINNAGKALAGTVEMITSEDLMRVLDVNLLGMLRVLHHVLPLMRERRSGRVINLSSAAGVIGFPGFDAYIASKFAIEGLTESLWYELRPYGIAVSLIEPGPVATDLLDKAEAGKRLAGGANPYSTFVRNVIGAYNREFKSKMQSATAVAEVISRVLRDRKPKLRYQTSFMVKRAVGKVRKDISGSKHLQRFAKMIEP